MGLSSMQISPHERDSVGNRKRDGQSSDLPLLQSRLKICVLNKCSV